MEKIKRDTNEDLMNNVFELVKKCHCYDKAEEIMDYFHAESYKTMELSDYEFDFDAHVQFGANEGIYIDCSIRGHFDENEPSDKKQILHCGSFKTLGTSLEDMRIMSDNNNRGNAVLFIKHTGIIDEGRGRNIFNNQAHLFVFVHKVICASVFVEQH